MCLIFLLFYTVSLSITSHGSLSRVLVFEGIALSVREADKYWNHLSVRFKFHICDFDCAKYLRHDKCVTQLSSTHHFPQCQT
jgi:hypothetical protein